MSRKTPRPNHQILEEASTWFVTFRSRNVPDGTRNDFHDWLKRSPEHIRAYLEIASVYADIPAPAQGRTPPELIEKAKADPGINLFALNAAAPGIDPGQRSAHGDGDARRSSRWIFAARAALAASVLIFVLLGTWLYSGRDTYRTGIGEQRAITLSDGSIVELNARSKVRIAFAGELRQVELVEGQALFRVARDHSRPFIVHAGATSVRAVGTQFDVYRRSSGTTVTVIEGRVAVERQQEREVFLAVGEQLTVTPTSARKVERVNVAATTAWTQHQLVFDGTPLSDVLEEFSRYTTRRIVIDSPRLAALRISGQYTSTSPDSLLRFLSLQNGVVITQANGETHIRQE